ncbi:MAG: O-antigen ligase family protein [Deltaproteobacteria bacterium]|nr:O-antigen ligase family protein [Deltaproteobacteria bacterium]
MYLRFLGLLLLAALLTALVRALRPSRYGLVFGLLLLYIPVMERLPLNLAPGVSLLTIFLVVLFSLRAAGGTPPSGARSTAFRGLLYAWLAVSGFGFLMGVSGAMPLLDLAVLFKRWLDPILASLLALRITRAEDRKFMLACALIGYALVGVQGVREGLDIGSKVRIVGLIGQANELGAFLAMYAPLALVAALFLTTGLVRYALFGCLVFGAWALLFTQSRAALLALPVGVLTVLFVCGRGGMGLVGVLLVALMWAFPEFLPENATARFETIYVEDGPGTAEQLEPSAAARIEIWKGTLSMASAHPLGVGFAQFHYVIPQYAQIDKKYATDAHNFYLLIWGEFGLAGLLVLLALIWRLLANVWTVASQAADEFLRALGQGICATMLATLVVNFFGSRLMDIQVSTYLWVLSATLARACDTLRDTKSAPAAVVVSRLRENAWGLGR